MLFTDKIVGTLKNPGQFNTFTEVTGKSLNPHYVYSWEKYFGKLYNNHLLLEFFLSLFFLFFF